VAGVDFGGRGTPVLLVHGSGHNAAVWADVADRLLDHCRMMAVDLRVPMTRPDALAEVILGLAAGDPGGS